MIINIFFLIIKKRNCCVLLKKKCENLGKVPIKCVLQYFQKLSKLCNEIQTFFQKTEMSPPYFFLVLTI